MSGKGFASAEAKPLLPKAHCMGKIKIPKSKKIAIGQAIRSRWHFSLRFDIPQTQRHQHHQCGWHDKSPADTRSSGSSSAFSGYRRRKSVTGAIGHDAFASVL